MDCNVPRLRCGVCRLYAHYPFLNEICKKATGMEIDELMEDIGLNENEAEKFGEEFSKAIQGKIKTPSEEK